MNGNLTPPIPANVHFGQGTGTVTGTPLNDELGGGTVLVGGDGDDILYGPSYGGIEYGGAGNDFLYASSGPTVLNAGDGDNVVYGGDGPDLIVVGIGNNQLFGAGGSNVAVLSELYGQSTVTLNSAQSFVNGPAGDDTLYSVPTLRFLDGTSTTDPTSDAGQAYRLYQAAFGRAPDGAGLGYWADALDRGQSLADVAGSFVASPEFQARYGVLDAAGFVGALYRNVLGREADAEGLGYWTGRLNGGAGRAQVLQAFSESPENYGRTAPAFAQGLFAPGEGAMEAIGAFRAALGRAPDAGSLSFFANALRAGESMAQMVNDLLASPEAQASFAGVGDAGFVGAVIGHVSSVPDTSGAAYWQNQLANGAVSHTDVVEAYAMSAPVRADAAAMLTSGYKG